MLEVNIENRTATTFKGKLFNHTDSIASSLNIFTLDDNGNETGFVRINEDTLSYIKTLILEKKNIKMGACRDNPSQTSLGIYLRGMKRSPQLLSYLLPLLDTEGYLEHYKSGNAFFSKAYL
ncbi:MAG: hypothetical protein ABSH41_04095 [Syntrophobacteraceae bacterium]